MLDQTDVRALEQIARATVVSSQHAASIWNESAIGRSYEFGTFPVYVVRLDANGQPKKGLLVGHPNPPATASAISDPALPSGIGAVFQYDAQLDVLADHAYSWFADVAGAPTYAFAAWEKSFAFNFFDPGNPFYFSILVHEAFHRYQFLDAGWGTTFAPCLESDTEVLSSYPWTRDNVALALLENKVVLAGLHATSKANKLRALEQFLAIRTARAALPEVTIGNTNYIRCGDEVQEVLEGTATYVENRFRDAAEVAAPIPFEEMYLSDPDPASASELHGALAWRRFYGTGAAVGFLLDDVGGLDWRSAAAGGKTPSDWLTARFPTLGVADLAELIASAKSAYGYQELVTQAEQLLAIP